jgi:large subunit ribosomal protein L19e
MTDLGAQKRLAADVLDVGENRVWFDPSAQGEIAEAITRDEIRDLVQEGTIQADEPQGNSRGPARKRAKKRAYGHGTGTGSRKGKAGARADPEDDWQRGIRAQREFLRELRDDSELTPGEYRECYNRASGGSFDSVRDLRNFVEREYQ